MLRLILVHDLSDVLTATLLARVRVVIFTKVQVYYKFFAVLAL